MSDMRPMAEMATSAKRGLRLGEKFGRGGTEVRVRRAQQLVERRELDAADVKSMHSYFARHEVDKDTKTHSWDSDTDPSAGFIAWLLWDGDTGKAWVHRVVKSLPS
ncbi:MAG: hypothetical protein JWO26_1252 [Rhodospirillales bacterium]|jgi:hypothetical protein|nr:hypothetical protein [Rhodospirillales bacterium]